MHKSTAAEIADVSVGCSATPLRVAMGRKRARARFIKILIATIERFTSLGRCQPVPVALMLRTITTARPKGSHGPSFAWRVRTGAALPRFHVDCDNRYV